jgi:hypothetical protein
VSGEQPDPRLTPETRLDTLIDRAWGKAASGRPESIVDLMAKAMYANLYGDTDWSGSDQALDVMRSSAQVAFDQVVLFLNRDGAVQAVMDFTPRYVGWSEARLSRDAVRSYLQEWS